MSGRGRFDTGRQYERLAEQEDAAVLKTAGDFAGSSPAALTHGYPNRQRKRSEMPSSAGSNPAPCTTPGYPNQQRTPAQTRCVAGASPVPGTAGA